MTEMRWEIDERTIRDCPGKRTEVEWYKAVADLEKRLQGGTRSCRSCGQNIALNSKYHVSETEEWMPNAAKLPRGRWSLSAVAGTLAAARKLQKFMGPRATIWVRTAVHGNASSYRLYKE